MRDLSLNDLGAAKMLMELIVEAGKHGPVYQKIAEQAGKQLRKLMGEEQVGDVVITPAAGPANSQIRREDGTIEQLPKPKTVSQIQAENEAERIADAEAAAKKAAEAQAENERKAQVLANTPAKVYPEGATKPLVEDPVIVGNRSATESDVARRL